MAAEQRFMVVRFLSFVFFYLLAQKVPKIAPGPGSRPGRRVRVDYGVSREALTRRSSSLPTTP